MIVIKNTSAIPNNVITASKKRFIGNSSTHVHEFFEIEYIIDGSGICKIDGVEYPIRAGTLFLLDPSNTHEIISADAQLINIMFKCEYENEFFLLPALRSPMIELTEHDSLLISALLSEIISVFEKDIDFARLLLQCVIKKLKAYPRADTPAKLPYIQHTLLYITENFRHGITLESTAAHLNLCPTYLSELFAKQMGVTFKSYLDNVRFSYAKNLLSFTDLPICDVHKYAGFADYANFSRRFKKMFGMTPTEYRKKDGSKGAHS